MRHPGAVATLVLAVVLTASCVDTPLTPGSEVEAADRAITAWVAEHQSGWSAATTARTVPDRPAWTPSCSDPASNGYVSLRLTTERGEIELAFRCPLDEHTTVPELQQHFVRAVPWNLPVGITRPNWRFEAWLPLSSIYDGVTFHEPSPGFLAVDIRSTMRGVRAQNTRPDCAPVSDAASPCQLERIHRVPLQMRFTVLADFSALR